MRNMNGVAFIVLTSAMFLISCNSKPEPIVFGKDACHYCKMVIADPRFGAELITAKGRIYKYDALECMVLHIHEANPEHRLLLGIAYNRPKTLYPVDSLLFVKSPDYRSPMGEHLAAFYADTLNKTEVMNWAQIYGQISAKKDK